MYKYIDRENYNFSNNKEYRLLPAVIRAMILLYIIILCAVIYYYNMSVMRNYELIAIFMIFSIFYYMIYKRIAIAIVDIKNIIIV